VYCTVGAVNESQKKTGSDAMVGARIIQRILNGIVEDVNHPGDIGKRASKCRSVVKCRHE
jgi:hypothetical protein